MRRQIATESAPDDPDSRALTSACAFPSAFHARPDRDPPSRFGNPGPRDQTASPPVVLASTPMFAEGTPIQMA